MALSAFRRTTDHRTLRVTHQTHLSSSLDLCLPPTFDFPSPPPLPPLPPNVLPPRPLSLLSPPRVAQPFDPPPTLSAFFPRLLLPSSIGSSSSSSRPIDPTPAKEGKKKMIQPGNGINFSNRLRQSTFDPSRISRCSDFSVTVTSLVQRTENRIIFHTFVRNLYTTEHVRMDRKIVTRGSSSDTAISNIFHLVTKILRRTGRYIAFDPRQVIHTARLLLILFDNLRGTTSVNNRIIASFNPLRSAYFSNGNSKLVEASFSYISDELNIQKYL